jgi:uncharacterized Zn finger protein (UPF0148 family)
LNVTVLPKSLIFVNQLYVAANELRKEGAMSNVDYCPSCGITEFKNDNGKPMCTNCGRTVTEEEIAADIKARFQELSNSKKIFALNEDGVAEYVAATNKDQAVQFAEKCWGKKVVEEYFDEFMKTNPDSNWDEFVEDFGREMEEDEEFSLYSDKDGKTTTKTIGEFLQDITEFPSYFANSEY